MPIKYKDTTQLNTNTEERISKSLYKSLNKQSILKQAEREAAQYPRPCTQRALHREYS